MGFEYSAFRQLETTMIESWVAIYTLSLGVMMGILIGFALGLYYAATEQRKHK